MVSNHDCHVFPLVIILSLKYVATGKCFLVLTAIARGLVVMFTGLQRSHAHAHTYTQDPDLDPNPTQEANTLYNVFSNLPEVWLAWQRRQKPTRKF